VITFAVKKWFFDQPRVRALLEPAVADYLEHLGAWIRTTAQRSMRYRKYGSASAPGQPPSAHRPRALLRQHIYYCLDPQTRTVVVGAQVFASPNFERGASMGWNVPFVQEHGFSGTRRLRNWRWKLGMRGWGLGASGWPPRPYQVGDFAVIRGTTYLPDRPEGGALIRSAEGRLHEVKRYANVILLRTPLQAARATMLRPLIYGPMVLERKVTYPPRPFISAAMYTAIDLGLPKKFARQALQRFGLRRSA